MSCDAESVGEVSYLASLLEASGHHRQTSNDSSGCGSEGNHRTLRERHKSRSKFTELLPYLGNGRAKFTKPIPHLIDTATSKFLYSGGSIFNGLGKTFEGLSALTELPRHRFNRIGQLRGGGIDCLLDLLYINETIDNIIEDLDGFLAICVNLDRVG